ncbi:MAG: alpha/beta fold hydrolase [Lewinellaceae bacterium]|nr:alpha/beta fold hydrolase [Lewinellaceae bacterium]
MHFSTAGSGPALVFLHGFGEDSRIWEAFVALFEKTHQVICIDLPGFGQSDPVAGITIRDMASAVHAVLEKLQVGRFVLAGHSMGGYVALAYAQAWPTALRGLAMIHSHPYADSEEKKEGRMKSIEFVNRHGSARYAAQLIPSLFAPKFAEENPLIIKELIDRAGAYPAQGVTDALRAMYQRPDRSEVLQDIKCPVLFIIGKEDQAIPAELSKRQTALPATSSIHYLDGVGHMGMLEAQRETLEIVEHFLEGIEYYVSILAS